MGRRFRTKNILRKKTKHKLRKKIKHKSRKIKHKSRKKTTNKYLRGGMEGSAPMDVDEDNVVSVIFYEGDQIGFRLGYTEDGRIKVRELTPDHSSQAAAAQPSVPVGSTILSWEQRYEKHNVVSGMEIGELVEEFKNQLKLSGDVMGYGDGGYVGSGGSLYYESVLKWG